MMFAGSHETPQAVNAMLADMDIYCNTDIDDIIGYQIEGIADVKIDWDEFETRKGRKKKMPLNVLHEKEKRDPFVISQDIYSSASGICVKKWKACFPKFYKPLVLPEIDLYEESDGEVLGFVRPEGLSSLLSAVPSGKVASRPRIEAVLAFVYNKYFEFDKIDTTSCWFGYSEKHPRNSLYRLYEHRAVDEHGEIYGNGMSCGGYRGKTFERRNDARKLQNEGVPTIELDYHCYVKNLKEYNYDFSDLIFCVESDG